MDITLLASGSSRLQINDFKGDIPWSHLVAYREFLIRHITGNTVLIGKKTFQMDFFQKLLKQTQSKTIVLSTQNSLPAFQIKGLCQAIHYAQDSRVERLIVLGGERVFNESIAHANEVDYMQLDIDPRGESDFPAILNQDFHRVSLEPSREDCDGKIYLFEIQKYLRKKSCPKLNIP
jgi:dihydrofolate reductase